MKINNINTDIGVLFGRCIYLDEIQYDYSKGIITFVGEILITENNRTVGYFYKLSFKHVIAHFSCEIDTYYNLGVSFGEGSFCLIEESKWLKSLPIRKDFDKSYYNHYRLYTYDDVFDLFANSYKMEIDLNNVKYY